MADADPDTLFVMADLYASRERWAAIEDREFNTQDLDAHVSYASWRSESNNEAYLCVVKAGQISAMPSLRELVLQEYAGDPSGAESALVRMTSQSNANG